MCVPGNGRAGDELVAVGQPEAEVQDAPGGRAGALDERATHAEIRQPFGPASEDAVLTPPDFGADGDAFMESVLFHGCGRSPGCPNPAG